MQKNKKAHFSILETLAASILGNASSGQGVIRVGEETIIAGQSF